MKPVLKRHCEVFPVLDWIAAMTAHVPNQGEHLVRDYGWYSNVSRGKREKAQDQAQEAAPEGTLEIPPPSVSPALKQRWAQLIKKVYEADPLRCPRCEESMRIIAVIDQPEVLPHLGLRPYPCHAPPSRAVASLRLSPRWTVLQSLNNEGRGLGTTSTRSWAPVAQKVPRPCSCAIFLTEGRKNNQGEYFCISGLCTSLQSIQHLVVEDEILAQLIGVTGVRCICLLYFLQIAAWVAQG